MNKQCECGGEISMKFRLNGKDVCQECFLEHKDEVFRLSTRLKDEKNRRSLRFKNKFAQ